MLVSLFTFTVAYLIPTPAFMFTDPGIGVHFTCVDIHVHVQMIEGWHDPRVQILRRPRIDTGVRVQVCPRGGSSPAHLAVFTRFDKIARSPCAYVNHIVGVGRGVTVKTAAPRRWGGAHSTIWTHPLRQTQFPRKFCGERSDASTQNSPPTPPWGPLSGDPCLGTPARPCGRGGEVPILI